MRIFWDITKTNKNKVYSGLNRVSTKLCESLIRKGCDVVPIVWNQKIESFNTLSSKKPLTVGKDQYFITPELFCENERPGALKWLRSCEGKTAAIFHDAIPLKFPEFTWPKSVARHPHYLKELSNFDLILANSVYSQNELTSYWQWLELTNTPPVTAIPLGADFNSKERSKPVIESSGLLKILMIGILEPRKNQEVVLDAIEKLHDEGHKCLLSIVGRINPYFGKPTFRRIEKLTKKGVPVRYHQQISDEKLQKLYEETDITIFPSKTEGNGLPIIESIWNGKPPLVSPIPPHKEHAEGGEGVCVVDPMTADNLANEIRSLIMDPKKLSTLKKATETHQVPTWNCSADSVIEALQGK